MNEWKNRNFLAYVRVSSQEQAEKNISIPSQIEQINNYAKNNWYIISEFYKEENSAFKWTRKVFLKLINDLNTKDNIKWLIIFKFDRLSRNLDDFIKIDKVVRNKNLELISVTEPMLNSYLWRYLVRDMQNRAILYSEELSFRVKLWIRKKLQMWWNVWWHIPFWYDSINWKYIPNDKAKIVKKIFELYSTWLYWVNYISKVVKTLYNIENIPLIERIISNHLYIWKIVKKWEIWNEEYIFWWYDKAWTYKEEYDLNYIIPIISNELFKICQNIKDLRTTRNEIRNTTYPKIFKCKCWRNLARDDKKWYIYFRCPKKISAIFNEKCHQWYINFKNIYEEINWIIKKVIWNNIDRLDFIIFLKEDINEKLKNKQSLIENYNKKLNVLKEKQLEITNSYIDNKIPKEIFEISSNKINNDIEKIQFEINNLGDINKYIDASNKSIYFIETLWELEKKYNSTKSSQLLYWFFSIVANLVLDKKKALKHKLKCPFNFLNFTHKQKWCPERESNSHFSRNGILSPACLPIPPSRLIACLLYRKSSICKYFLN